MVTQIYDGENGVEGLTAGAAQWPAVSVGINGNGATLRYTSQAAMTGKLGYHFNAKAGSANSARLEVTDSKQQAFRGNFRLISAAANRRIVRFRDPGGGSAVLLIFGPPQLRLENASAGVQLTLGSLTVGVDYDISVFFTIGASTNDSQASVRVYEKNTNNLVTSASASNLNLGTQAIAEVEVGSSDGNASDMEYAWDLIRFDADRGEFPAPIAASATISPVASIAASAVTVPHVRDALLALEE